MKELGMELFQEVVAAHQALKSGTLQFTPIAPGSTFFHIS